MRALLFFMTSRRIGGGRPFSVQRPRPGGFAPGATWKSDMQQVRSFLRGTRTRIAQIVAIAAASLPSAGA
jgi:type IV secretory pathway VirB2 component (pilin)